MEIKTVKTNSDLMQFIKFPWQIYKNDPNWVPPLIFDIKFILTKSPFWEHAEKALFIAYDDEGKPAGRIAAIIDRNYIQFQGEKAGFFGFFECINNTEIAQRLFKEASSWLKGKGMEIMMGPANPSTNDECGFLCYGLDMPPRLMMPYNPAYYLDLASASGLIKEKELFAYDMDVADGPLKRLERIVDIAYKKNPGLIVRPINKKDFKNEIGRAVQVYNAAWEKNWGFVPWTEKEFYTIAERMKALFLPETSLLAMCEGKPVGMLIALPDYNTVMQKMDGRLFPSGFLKFYYYKSKIQALRLMIMGVVKDWRQRGIEGVMYYESLKNAQKLGYKQCEFSWVLDDNVMTQRAAEMMGGRLYKRYRVYETRI